MRRKKKSMSKSNKVLKGGASSDMFSYSGCANNPGTDGTWSSLSCDIGNIFTGIGKTFDNGFGAIGNMVDLGKIVID